MSFTIGPRQQVTTPNSTHLAVLFRFYPSATGGFVLIGGLGLGTMIVTFDDVS